MVVNGNRNGFLFKAPSTSIDCSNVLNIQIQDLVNCLNHGKIDTTNQMNIQNGLVILKQSIDDVSYGNVTMTVADMDVNNLMIRNSIYHISDLSLNHQQIIDTDVGFLGGRVVVTNTTDVVETDVSFCALRVDGGVRIGKTLHTNALTVTPGDIHVKNGNVY